MYFTQTGHSVAGAMTMPSDSFLKTSTFVIPASSLLHYDHRISVIFLMLFN
jgi:hypothetical protein